MTIISWLRRLTKQITISNRAWRRRAKHASRVKSALSFRPGLTYLEGRTLPSVYLAYSASDLTLDIQSANAGGGANQITLDPGLGSPYELTQALPGIAAPAIVSAPSRRKWRRFNFRCVLSSIAHPAS